MRKILSSSLIRLALWLYPESREMLAPSVEGYISGKVGFSVELFKSDIRRHMKAYNVSQRKSEEALIDESKKSIRLYTAKTIGDMMEFEVSKSKDCVRVSGHVKVYKRDGKKEGH